MKLAIRLLSILALPFLIILGCGTQQNESPADIQTVTRYSKLGPPASNDEGNAEYVYDALSASSFGEGASPAAPSFAPSPQTRMLIKTADLICEVDNFDEARAQIQSLAEQNGGYIVSSQTSVADDNHKSGRVSLRIPSDKFDKTLTALKNLVKKTNSESINGNDVTEEFYDVSARLDNKRKAEQRFQEILKTAYKTTEILEVERALMNVREEIERMEGRKRFLADQVALSTINVNLYEPRPLLTGGRDSFWGKIKRGFENGLEGFGDVLSASITFVIAVLPLAPLGFLFWWGIPKLYRSLRGRKSPATLNSPPK
ncbi:hypothetical protein DCC62_05795 [candidate division KSB1 bacterium]|nr:MAG: hypothetical protein DCC62_05795 [candidate division KSB1 bacterium]